MTILWEWHIIGWDGELKEIDLNMLTDTTTNLRGIEMDNKQHKTVPAPRVLSDDPSFGPAVISDEAKDYLVQKFESDMARTYDENGNTKEPDNIHELMYKMYSDGMTAQQLPWASIQKNSPPLWQSGTGMGQFREDAND